MRQRFPIGLLVLTVAFFGSGIVRAGDAGTGSIKGEITANGVKSLEDVVVYIETVPGQQKPPEDPVEVDQKKLVFVPHVKPIVVGTKVVFKNGDPLLHNVFWTASDDGSYPAKNLGTWGQGDTKTYTFDKPGHVGLLCNIHPEMEGYILVLQNPFFAVVGRTAPTRSRMCRPETTS